MENTVNTPESYKNVITLILEGGEFNGTVYQKNNGKNWCMLFVYVDGNMVSLGSTQQKFAKQDKVEFLQFLQAEQDALIAAETTENTTEDVTEDVAEPTENTWLVNEKKTTNNLSYSDMYYRYGMDFE